MQQRSGARELGLIVATIGVLVHFVDPARAAVATVLIAAAAALGTANLAGEARPWRLPLIPVVLPVLAAFAIAGVSRLVEPVPWLGLVFLAGWAVTAWVVRLETAPLAPGTEAPPGAALPAIAGSSVRLRPRPRAEFDLARIVAEPMDARPDSPAHPRPVAVRSACLGLAFVAFTAVGGLVPGGFADGGGPPGRAALAATVGLDLLVAGLLGYRIASITRTTRFDRIVRILAFIQYAVPVGAAGAILRVAGLPRLFGPALLTLIVYIVTVVRDSSEPLLLNRRLLQELAVLGTVGAVAVVWGLMVK
jgi:hypothetical protein